MNDEIISFETAKLAKEKGFDWETRDYYRLLTEQTLFEPRKAYKAYYNKYDDGYTSAPTQSLLQKWLREEHDILLCIEYSLSKEDWFYYVYKNDVIIYHYSTYEAALEAGLMYALKAINDD